MQDKTFYVHYELKYKQDTYCYADELQASSFAEAERIIEERHGNDPLTPLTITSIRQHSLQDTIMTRKDFQLIADTIKTSLAFVKDEQRQCFALDIAHGLKETNPRFDISRFLKACGC